MIRAQIDLFYLLGLDLHVFPLVFWGLKRVDMLHEEKSFLALVYVIFLVGVHESDRKRSDELLDQPCHDGEDQQDLGASEQSSAHVEALGVPV